LAQEKTLNARKCREKALARLLVSKLDDATACLAWSPQVVLWTLSLIPEQHPQAHRLIQSISTSQWEELCSKDMLVDSQVFVLVSQEHFEFARGLMECVGVLLVRWITSSCYHELRRISSVLSELYHTSQRLAKFLRFSLFSLIQEYPEIEEGLKHMLPWI